MKINLGLFGSNTIDDDQYSEHVHEALVRHDAKLEQLSATHDERAADLATMAAYGNAMANGGVLGPAAAAIPLVELPPTDEEFKELVKAKPTDFGKYVATRWLPVIREQLGLLSYAPEHVRPLVEAYVEAEEMRAEANEEIGSGIFRGLVPPSFIDTVEPLPVARYSYEYESTWSFGPRMWWLHDAQVFGITQAQCDALLDTKTQSSDPVDDAVAVVVGDITEMMAAKIADVVEAPRREWWRRKAPNIELDVASARRIVALVSDICEYVASASVRRALADLAADEAIWRHFEWRNFEARNPQEEPQS